MNLSKPGKIVTAQWLWLPKQYDYVELDDYVVMPNHLHGIISITDHDKQRKPLGQLIGAFKTKTTKQANLLLSTPGQMLWQRNFFERVIRNSQELERAREYIVNNPTKWSLDGENPNVCR